MKSPPYSFRFIYVPVTLLHMLFRSQLAYRHLSFTQASRSSAPLQRAMSTFNLSDSGVPVHLTSDLSKDQLLSFPAFKTWIKTLQHSLSTQQNKSHTFHSTPYKLRQINIQSVDFFGGERVGFIKLKAEVSNDNGEKLPGSVFLRGGSVGMMVSTFVVPEKSTLTINPSSARSAARRCPRGRKG